ncbi:hypothetical protein [Micromonospora hortensis]|uniref:preATP grasp domain-containing protein n=1 Tax=Micromonospora hortensis TaxID=2911209 RepID=UPI001EE97CE0|nr:hypothetical protein [Micromonospora hortensis]MCG5450984.1 hypothetical protein [Micromonospora hortensis]
MRILIGNHIDPAIRDRKDLRAWTQRVLWFARDGDLIVLSDEPDPQFLHYATSFTDVDPQTLRVLIPPAGSHAGLLLDPETLIRDDFLQTVRGALGDDGPERVDEVFALWPSASVARFAAALGIRARFAGSDFFAQGGGELVNNKATFRALAAGAGVPTPAGAVCRSGGEAVCATVSLLGEAGAVVVKQAHNGAGVGNQLLLCDPRLASDHVGARHLYHLADGGRETVEAYWRQRWDWASAHERFPVVIEEFVPEARSIYSEHCADSEGTRPTESGELLYVGRRLSHQIVPLRGVDDGVRSQLLRGGGRLADTYRALGYRGHLSADAIVTVDGRVLFTEVNAQVSGSLHIYQVIAHRIVDTAAAPRRSVVEYHTAPTWAVSDADTFLKAVDELGYGYDPVTRTGVIVSMPIIPVGAEGAHFLFCVAYGEEAEHQAIWDGLDSRFRGHA